MSGITRGTSPFATRPRLPKDYGILSEDAGSGLLPWSRASESLATSRNYWIHTTCPNGCPRVKPVWSVWFEERFYFSTNPKSIAGRNLLRNNSLAVHLESGDDVVILEGEAEQIYNQEFLSRLDEVYFAKYAFHLPQDDSGVVFGLEPKSAFAWLERDFAGGATKYLFEI